MNIKDLCLQYDAASLDVDSKKAAYERAIVDRSEIVKKIAQEIHPAKKFLYKGKELTIVVRGDTWFFRGGKQSKGLVEVE